MMGVFAAFGLCILWWIAVDAWPQATLIITAITLFLAITALWVDGKREYEDLLRDGRRRW